MLIFFSSALLALISGVVAGWDRLVSTEESKKKLGITALVLIAMSQAVIGLQTWKKEKDNQDKDESLRLQRDFFERTLPEIDEASGGTTSADGEVAYIVDDEEPVVFKLKYDKDEQKYVYKSNNPLTIKRPGNCKNITFKSSVAKEEAEEYQKFTKNFCSKSVLTKTEIDDLEGAAFYNGKLYVVTSHSEKKTQDGRLHYEREWFLELSLQEGHEGEILRGVNYLKQDILEEFKPKPNLDGISTERLNEDKQRELMNIEGLAIDDQGRVYFGFREPLAGGKYAVVLRVSSLDQLFGKHPQFERFHLALQNETKDYAIVSLEYDQQSHSILILGNSQARDDYTYTPYLWRWRVEEGATQQTPPRAGAIPITHPQYLKSKPEVVLAPPKEQLFFFLDAERHGGERVFDRTIVNLKN